MSWKKKRLTKKEKQNKVILLISLVALVIVLFVLMLCEMFISHKDYYESESRVSNVALAKDSNNEKYQTIGWLKVQGTNLDLPILTGINDETNYPVEKKKYVWNMGEKIEFQNKIDIMGHNIYNLSSSPKKNADYFDRFEELMSFVYYDFAKENKYFQITIDGKDYIYKIFSVDFINAVDVDRFPSGKYTKDDIKYQLKLFKENTLYDYQVDVNEDDSIASLITCTRFFGTDHYIDFLVNGRLVRKGEKINNYSVTKNNNYKKVEKILKGDDKDESDSSM